MVAGKQFQARRSGHGVLDMAYTTATEQLTSSTNADVLENAFGSRRC